MLFPIIGDTVASLVSEKVEECGGRSGGGSSGEGRRYRSVEEGEDRGMWRREKIEECGGGRR